MQDRILARCASPRGRPGRVRGPGAPYQADVWRFAHHFTRDRGRRGRHAGGVPASVPVPPRLPRRDAVHGWLFRIARNCAMDASRAELRRREGPPSRSGRTDTDAVPPELHAALDAVSAEHREPFLLVEVFGLSYQEAADVQGVRVGTIKSRMHRARKENAGRSRSRRTPGELRPAEASSPRGSTASARPTAGRRSTQHRRRAPSAARSRRRVPGATTVQVRAPRRSPTSSRRSWRASRPSRSGPPPGPAAADAPAPSARPPAPPVLAATLAGSWPAAWSSAGRGNVRAPADRRGRRVKDVRRAAPTLDAYEATFAITEHDLSPDVPERRLRCAWRSWRRSDSVWTSTTRPTSRRRLTPTNLAFIVDGSTTYRSGATGCPAASRRAAARSATTFATASPTRCARRRRPTWCCRSRRSRRPTASRCSGRIASRDATRSRCNSRSHARTALFPFLQLGGTWRPFFATTAWTSGSMARAGSRCATRSIRPPIRREPWELRFGMPREPRDRRSSTSGSPRWTRRARPRHVRGPRLVERGRACRSPRSPDASDTCRSRRPRQGRSRGRRRSCRPAPTRRAEHGPPVHGRDGVRADRGTARLDRAEAVRPGEPGRQQVDLREAASRTTSRRATASAGDSRSTQRRRTCTSSPTCPARALDAGSVAARPRRSATRRLANARPARASRSSRSRRTTRWRARRSPSRSPSTLPAGYVLASGQMVSDAAGPADVIAASFRLRQRQSGRGRRDPSCSTFRRARALPPASSADQVVVSLDGARARGPRTRPARVDRGWRVPVFEGGPGLADPARPRVAGAARRTGDPMRSVPKVLAGLVVGLILGATVTLAVQSRGEQLDTATRSRIDRLPRARGEPEAPATFLAWVPGGLPNGFTEPSRTSRPSTASRPSPRTTSG